MTFMSKRQHRVLQELHALAKGDSLLVERALRQAAPDKDHPSLSDVTAFIRDQTHLSTHSGSK